MMDNIVTLIGDGFFTNPITAQIKATKTESGVYNACEVCDGFGGYDAIDNGETIDVVCKQCRGTGWDLQLDFSGATESVDR